MDGRTDVGCEREELREKRGDYRKEKGDIYKLFRYIETIKDLHGFPKMRDAADEEQFAQLLRNIYARHSKTLIAMCKGAFLSLPLLLPSLPFSLLLSFLFSSLPSSFPYINLICTGLDELKRELRSIGDFDLEKDVDVTQYPPSFLSLFSLFLYSLSISFDILYIHG